MADAHSVDTNKLNQFLGNKMGPCPLCRKLHTFVLAPTLMELREFREGGLVVGDTPIMPLAVLTCNYCGNTVLINALVAGVLEDSGKPQNTQKGAEGK